MGWGLSFKADIYLSKETYNSEHEVEQEIEDLTESIDRCKRRIALMISANPSTFIEKGEDIDPLYDLDNKISSHLESLEENIIRRYRLQLLLNNWDKRKIDEP